MSDKTALKRAGIDNLDQIKKIKVEHSETADTLVVYYGRSFFGLLSKRKKLIFNRPSRQVFLEKKGRSGWQSFSCPSPQFQRVMDELSAA